jgi:hypothetical protein
LSNTCFSQSVTYGQLKQFVKQDWQVSEDYIVYNKFFKLKEKKILSGNDTVNVYDNSVETFYMGLDLTTTTGKKIKDLTYMTTAKSFILSLFKELSLTDFVTSQVDKEYDAENRREKYFIKNDSFAIQMFIADDDGELSLFQISER